MRGRIGEDAAALPTYKRCSSAISDCISNDGNARYTAKDVTKSGTMIFIHSLMVTAPHPNMNSARLYVVPVRRIKSITNRRKSIELCAMPCTRSFPTGIDRGKASRRAGIMVWKSSCIPGRSKPHKCLSKYNAIIGRIDLTIMHISQKTCKRIVVYTQANKV